MPAIVRPSFMPAIVRPSFMPAIVRPSFMPAIVRPKTVDITRAIFLFQCSISLSCVSPAAQHRLAPDAAGASPNLVRFSCAFRANAWCPLSHLPAAQVKPGVGRSLSPSVVRPGGWRAARAGAWGPDLAAVAWGARERCVGRAPSVAWGAAGRTRYACRYRRAHARMGGGRPPAAPLPNQPPNHARSRHRWRGP